MTEKVTTFKHLRGVAGWQPGSALVDWKAWAAACCRMQALGRCAALSCHTRPPAKRIFTGMSASSRLLGGHAEVQARRCAP